MIYKLRKIYGNKDTQWIYNVRFNVPSELEVDIASQERPKDRYVIFRASDVLYTSIEQGALLGDYEFEGDAYPMPCVSEVIDSPMVQEFSRDKEARYSSLMVFVEPAVTKHFVIFGEDRYVQTLFNGEYEIDHRMRELYLES